MTDEQRKALTKYLGECWHEFVVAFPPVEPEQIPVRGHKCKHCGKYWPTKIRDGHGSRTFDNRNDMMDLYQKVYEDGKWGSFSIFSLRKFKFSREDVYLNAWRFCLDGKGYEERCKLVAKFYGWEEGE